MSLAGEPNAMGADAMTDTHTTHHRAFNNVSQTNTGAEYANAPGRSRQRIVTGRPAGHWARQTLVRLTLLALVLAGTFVPSIPAYAECDPTLRILNLYPQNGTATASPLGSGMSQTLYTPGTQLTLSCTPNSGYSFIRWEIYSGGWTTLGTSNPTNI